MIHGNYSDLTIVNCFESNFIFLADLASVIVRTIALRAGGRELVSGGL